MAWELSDAVGLIIEECKNPVLKRRDVAKSYYLAMKSSDALGLDWRAINEVIIARWSLSGLLWIKYQAHSGKCWQ